MLGGFVVLILVSVLSMLNSEDIENGIRRIRKLMNLIFLIPIFIALVSVRLNLIKPFLAGSCIGGFVLLAITAYQEYFLGMARIPGFYNAIMFGSIAVITILALFVSLLLIKSKKIYLGLISLSLLGSMYAGFMAGTRGAWISLIVGVPLGLYLVYRSKEISRKRIFLAMIASILLISIAGILAKDEITSRWDSTVQNIELFQTGINRNTSIGWRLVMWDAAVKVWSRHPIIGTGVGDFQMDYWELINGVEPEFEDVRKIPFTYAHSIIFEALAGTGILGLFGLIMSIFILPTVFFINAYITSENQWDMFASVFGLLFVFAFMIFGLTENWLAHNQLVMTFSLLLAIMASRFSARTE